MVIAICYCTNHANILLKIDIIAYTNNKQKRTYPFIQLSKNSFVKLLIKQFN